MDVIIPRRPSTFPLNLTTVTHENFPTTSKNTFKIKIYSLHPFQQHFHNKDLFISLDLIPYLLCCPIVFHVLVTAPLRIPEVLHHPCPNLATICGPQPHQPSLCIHSIETDVHRSQRYSNTHKGRTSTICL